MNGVFCISRRKTPIIAEYKISVHLIRHKDQTRLRYSPVLVSIFITSPWFTKSGTLT
jgi:hypothetical protein